MRTLRLEFATYRSTVLLAARRVPDQPLRIFLQQYPARVAEALPCEWLDLPMREFELVPVSLGPDALDALAGPGELSRELDAIFAASGTAPAVAPDPPVAVPQASAVPPAASGMAGGQPFPPALTDSEAVARAYADEIRRIGRYLSNDLSVLVICDKVLAEYVYRHALRQSNKQPVTEEDRLDGERSDQEAAGMFQRESSGPATRINHIGKLLATIKSNQALVLQHLDTLAGGSAEGPMTAEARLLTEVLYRSQESTPTLLGFADPSLGLPRVISDRFAVRIELAGLSRDVVPRLITSAERERFKQFEAEMLFKNVSGFNAVQLRNAMRYLLANSSPGAETSRLMALIREFKRGSGEEVEIPNVSFNDIGGYEQVKRDLFEAVEMITGKRPPFNPDGTPFVADPADMVRPESEAEREQRRKLAPRGFIFHGAPGTGKTLFAKAIANAMNATIQMISGPEIMDMWVGKSESNLRRIFAIARRNAPAVIFFDEFDSIAVQRSGFGDGGSRASNAVVAQLLTELDGFRADQDMLVIGTTNRLDIIDEALLRPSRFQPMHIPLPDKDARRQIAAIHARTFEVPVDDPYLLELIAEFTDNFNGDEIRAVFQEIARQSRRGLTISAETFGVQIGLIRKRRDERLISHIGTSRRR